MTPAPAVKGKLSDSTRMELAKAMIKHLVALHSEGAGGQPVGPTGQSAAPQQPQPQAASPQQPASNQPMPQQPQAQQVQPQPGAPQMPNVVHIVHHIVPHKAEEEHKMSAEKKPELKTEARK